MFTLENSITVKCLNCGVYFPVKKEMIYTKKNNNYSLSKIICPECNKIGKCVLSKPDKNRFMNVVTQ